MRPGARRHLVAARAAQLHELLAHAAVRLALRIFQVVDDEHGVAVRRVADRGGGQRDHGTALAQSELRLHEHARPQPASGVRERGLDLHVARSLVHDRIEGCDATSELVSRQIFRTDMQGASPAYLNGVLLRHSKIDINRIQRLQRNDCIPSRQVLAEVDFADSQNAGKWSADRFAIDGRFGLGDVRFRLLLLGYGRVKVCTRDYARIQQLLHAGKVGSRQIALRLKRGQLSPFLPGVEFDQHVPFMNVLTGLERYLVHCPGKIGTYRDAMYGFHGANHAHGRRPGLLVRDNTRHCLRRRLEM